MKIFVDCGANRGQSVEKFRELFPDHEEYVIYCFEPHAELALNIDISPNEGEVFAEAVDTRYGYADFYRGPSTLGSTLFPDKITGDIAKIPTPVRSCNLPKFIREIPEVDDFVVLKLNVEGSEYPILREMLDTGIIPRINRLFVRWHYMKIPSISEVVHHRLIKDLKKAGVVCEDLFW